LTFLADYQAKVDRGDDVQLTWDAARDRKGFTPVHQALRRMAGGAERCMYCEDSLGSDVDHFWPKKGRPELGYPGYPERAFRWDNLLLSCTPCGRAKGVRFPLDDQGRPLLVDPTAEDPLAHFDFVPATGELVAAWAPDGTRSTKGSRTIEVLQDVLNRQAVARRRRDAYDVQKEAVEEYLGGHRTSESLLSTIGKHKDFGLAQWCFLGRGTTEEPFATLARDHPDVWAEAQQVARVAT
jgi:uncharacterized protein (TIGR02646 family)